MIKINILCVGKIKEKYFTDAAEEYIKRLKRYCNISITEVPDEKCPENLTAAEINIIKQKEACSLIKALKPSFLIALAIEGRSFASMEFAKFFQDKMNNGINSFTFIIGGSVGLSTQITEKADICISFSEMTFPHQLMRVILLEQLYRIQRIIKNEPYHK